MIVLESKIIRQKSEKEFLEYFDKNVVEIEKSLDFISETTETFVDFFRDNPSLQSIDLKLVIERFFYVFNETVVEKSISIELNLDKNIEYLSNKNYINQILLSLLSNSIEAFERNSIKNRKITVNLSEKKNNIFIEFIDNAGGIKDELLPNKLFEYNTSSKKDSLGLGLYIVKLLVKKKLNANIDVQNITDGCMFKIKLDKL